MSSVTPPAFFRIALGYVIATWGLVMAKIFARSVDIFRADRDAVAGGFCESYFVLVMVVHVQNAAVIME